MRRTLIFGLLGALAVTALWFFFIFRPINERITTANDELEIAQGEELNLRAQVSQLKAIEENELAYTAALGQIEAAVPRTPQMPALIDDLNQLANDTGVIWVGANYGQPLIVVDQEYLEIPITIQITGQFFEVLGYVYGMADLDRLVRIDGVTMNAVQDEDGFTELDVQLTAKAFTSGIVILPEFPEEEEEEDEETTSTTQPADGTTATTVPAATTTTVPGDTTTTTVADTTTTTVGSST